MSKDVAIIGGSTAGLFTAHLLARQGLNVKVFEARERIDSPPRTLIVTRNISNLLESLCEKAVVNKIHCFELFADGRIAAVPLQQPDLVIESSKLIQRLATLAEESGAQILTGQRFISLKPNGKTLTFSVTENGDGKSVERSADILIGADGASSKVAQSGGWPEKTTVPLFQAVVELPKDMPSDTTRVWFLPEETPYFYWLIPHSQTHGVLGMIAQEEKIGRAALERFLDKKGLVPLDFQSAFIPLYVRWSAIYRKIGGGHVYLVGDAAGHVKASTVGGIVTGLRGALGVAEAILNGGTSRELRVLNRELDMHWLIRRSLHGFDQRDYVRLLDMLNPASRRLLSVLTRDETVKLLFHLLLRQPRLLLLGLKSLISS